MKKSEKIHSVYDLGFRVREFRQEQGLTLEEAASLCGVGIRFLSEFENGKSTIQMEKALKVAYLIGLDVLVSRRQNFGEE